MNVIIFTADEVSKIVTNDVGYRNGPLMAERGFLFTPQMALYPVHSDTQTNISMHTPVREDWQMRAENVWR